MAHGELIPIARFPDGTHAFRQDLDLYWASFRIELYRLNVGVLLLFKYDESWRIQLPGRLDGWQAVKGAALVEIGRKIRGLTRALGIGYGIEHSKDSPDSVVGEWDVSGSGPSEMKGEVFFVPDDWIRYVDLRRRKKGEEVLDHVRRVLPSFEVAETEAGSGWNSPTRFFRVSRAELPFWIRVTWQQILRFPRQTVRPVRLDQGSWNVGYENVVGPDAVMHLQRKKEYVGLYSGSLPAMLRIFWTDVMHLRPKSERTEWEAKHVEPAELLVLGPEEIRMYRALGEELPVLWNFEDFARWYRERSEV